MVNNNTQVIGPHSKECLIDLGHSEKVAGLTYVALSRVRKLSDLVIEPMTFDRLCLLQKKHQTIRIKYSSSNNYV